MKSISKGRQLRDAAIKVIETTRHDWLSAARKEAVKIARRRGRVTINDVRAKVTLPKGMHHNSWGAVLKCKELKAVGYDQAHHPAAHARVVRVYQLADAA